MVYLDISEPQPTSARPLAPVHDRFLAFAFDLCLWVPIAFLLLKPLWRRVQYLNLVESSTNELSSLVILSLSLGVLLYAVVQAVMVRQWGTTPGKRLFQVYVIDIRTGQKPSLGAAILRSLTWMFELALLGLPFLEILSQPERRPWHDRVSETMVVTRKAVGADAPHWLEQRFFSNLYWGTFLFCLLVGFGQLQQILPSVANQREKLTQSGYLCADITKMHESSQMTSAHRLDLGLALYLSERLDRECLETEADFAVWTQDAQSLPWAHLVRDFLRAKPAPDQTSVNLRACEIADQSAACQLAKWRVGQLQEVNDGAQNTFSYLVLKTKDLFGRGEFKAAQKFIGEREWPEPLKSFAQARYLQSQWIESPGEHYQRPYQFGRIAWNADMQVKMDAWTCMAELSRQCGQAIPSCAGLRERAQLSQQSYPALVYLALARESSCSGRRDVNLQNLYAQFPQQELSWLPFWMSPPPRSSQTHRWEKIFAAATAMSVDYWLYSQALWALSNIANSKEQLAKLQALFNRGTSDDAFWWIARNEFMAKAKTFGFEFLPTLQAREPTSPVSSPRAAGSEEGR